MLPKGAIVFEASEGNVSKTDPVFLWGSNISDVYMVLVIVLSFVVISCNMTHQSVI